MLNNISIFIGLWLIVSNIMIVGLVEYVLIGWGYVEYLGWFIIFRIYYSWIGCINSIVCIKYGMLVMELINDENPIKPKAYNSMMV